MLTIFQNLVDAAKYRFGQLSAEEEAQYNSRLAQEKDGRECKQCNEFKDWNLNYSPTVRFMRDEIAKIGGNINSSNVICGKCDEMKSGGFHPELGILLCQNKIYSRSHCEDTMAHEMVHAYDHCRFEVDWTKLQHHACSEIRASSLSGECRMMNEMFKHGFLKFGRGHQECVRRRATLSVMANPNCKDREMAELVVDQVFDQCFNDTRPFDEIYR
ncbi:Mitochondrial inner membrane protease ATP23 [Wickerhamiella sorbophila]|uniref:Mitochondrial inner membrane protease ATP23 n=1 Tax=Wickerhamiella sorbophila TaxID=45607 RepID=A0A2T0FG99_9ASCO|nr:Mitochondrial inner membrane protease ATP23 [Wickerhamiella sorbophila]PRT54018.1 Mitochondrial inner membrane protease ATP23 [Wickerhamiella sorbophila]